MWPFIKTYFTRAVGPLLFAGSCALYALISSIVLPSVATLGLAYLLGAYALTYMLIPLILNRFNLRYDGRIRNTQMATHGVTAFLVFVSMPYIFPHYFLLFNALPFVLPNTAFVLTTFLTAYEIRIRSRHYTNLGDAFSLVKMIFNPRVRLVRLYRIIMPTPPANLPLTDTEREALVDRQHRALNQLPNQAFIPRSEIDTIANIGNDERRNQAVLEMNRGYINSLTPEQQTYYRKYQELTIKFSPNIAQCPISLEPVTLATQNEFILVEKRTIGNARKPAKAVPANSYIFQRLSFDTNRASQAPKPRIAGSEDLINTPAAWEEHDTEYKCHEYALVQGHPLSLQLCEAIEKFNISLGLAPGADSGVPRQRPVPPPADAATHVEAEEVLPTAVFVPEENTASRGAPLSPSPGTNRFSLNPPPPTARPTAIAGEEPVVAEPIVEHSDQAAAQNFGRTPF